MFEKFTDRARTIMGYARQEAQRYNSEFIGTEHMLIAMLKEGGGAGAKALARLGIDEKAVRIETEKLITPSTTPTVSLGQTPYSPRAKRAMELACNEAYRFKSTVVSSGHLLLGLYLEAESISCQVMKALGVSDVDRLRDEVAGFEKDTRGESGDSQEPVVPDDPVAVRARIRLFRRVETKGDDESTLMVAEKAYQEAFVVTVNGISNLKIAEVAAEIARKHDTDVYILDIS